MANVLFAIGSVDANVQSKCYAVGHTTKSDGSSVGLVTGGRYAENGTDLQLVVGIDLTESFRDTAFATSTDWFAAIELGNRTLHINYLVTPEDEDYEIAKAFIDHHTNKVPVGEDGSFQLNGLAGQGFYYLDLSLSMAVFAVESVLSRRNQRQNWVSRKFTWEGNLVRNTAIAFKKSTIDDLLGDSVPPSTLTATPAPDTSKLPAPPAIV